MSRVALLTLVVTLGCGGTEAPTFATDLGLVEVSPTPAKPNPFTSSCLRLPSSIRLPEAKATCSRSNVEVDLTNTCAFTVKLSSARSGAFGFARLPPALGPNASTKATLSFLPTSSGRHAATLQLLASADGYTQTTSLQLDATATAPRTATADTRMPAFAPEEVLIIVDDDGLPDADEQLANMARQLSSSSKHVVVSDLSGNVQRPDGIAVLVSDSPAFVDRLTRALHPPRASGLRSCHETALRLKRDRQPAGFWKPGSRRSIACIMNEADQSNVPASSMVGAWSVPFGDTPTPFLVIAPFSLDTCGVADARLERLALETGGVREALCGPDWSGAIGSLSRTGHPLPFVLHLPPPGVRSSDSVSVSIDGIALPRWAWRFDSVAGAIQLTTGPEPERLLRATWETCDD